VTEHFTGFSVIPLFHAALQPNDLGVERGDWIFGILEKSDGLVHCSVENATVLGKNHRERVTQIWTTPSEKIKKEEEEEEEEEKEEDFGHLATTGSVLCNAF